MSEYGEYDDEIDWDEAGTVLDAAQRQHLDATVVADQQPASSVIAVDADELQLAYDILEQADENRSLLLDIEDVAAPVEAEPTDMKTLFDQFR